MNTYDVICCCVSSFFNCLLISLIVFKSPKEFGVYRYLMLYISFFEALYSILDVVAQATVHSYKGAYVVFRYSKNSIFNENTSFILVCLYAGFFGFSLALFGVHFVYRYGAIEENFHLKYLSGKKILFLFIMPVLYLFWAAGLIFFFLRSTEASDRYMEKSIFETYGYKIQDISYLCVLYHPLDQNGISHPDWRVFGILSFFWFMMLSSMFGVFFFGFKCYSEIQKILDLTVASSKLTKNLQQQLFRALVIQTLIPFVLIYTPMSIVFISPMLNINIGFNTHFITYTISTYPAIDPLPNILIIKCYRSAITDFLRRVILRPIQKLTGTGMSTVSMITTGQSNMMTVTDNHARSSQLVA